MLVSTSATDLLCANKARFKRRILQHQTANKYVKCRVGFHVT